MVKFCFIMDSFLQKTHYHNRKIFQVGNQLTVDHFHLHLFEPLPNDARPWTERISQEREDLMLVGHLPFLEKLTSLLLCGNEKTRLVLFRYGAIVCLEQREDKGWGVRWILTPEMIGLLI